MVTPRLRNLSYHYACEVDSDELSTLTHSEYFDCRKLDSSLAHVRDTLETLKLAIDFYSLKYEVALRGFRGMKDIVRSLQNFRKLKSLDVPFVMLFGWEADPEIALQELLPPGLERLCCTDCLLGYRLLPFVENYLERVDPHIFKSLSLELRPKKTRRCESERERFRTMCRRAGIEHHIS